MAQVIEVPPSSKKPRFPPLTTSMTKRVRNLLELGQGYLRTGSSREDFYVASRDMMLVLGREGHHPTGRHPNGETAVNQVMRTPELLSLILEHCDSTSIISLRSITRSIKNHIDTHEDVQKRLHLVGDWTGFRGVVKILDSFPPHTRIQIHNKPLSFTVTFCGFEQLCRGLVLGPVWSQAFVTQPPMRTGRFVRLDDCNLPEVPVAREEGIRVIDVLSAMWSLVDRHRRYCGLECRYLYTRPCNTLAATIRFDKSIYNICKQAAPPAAPTEMLRAKSSDETTNNTREEDSPSAAPAEITRKRKRGKNSMFNSGDEAGPFAEPRRSQRMRKSVETWSEGR